MTALANLLRSLGEVTLVARYVVTPEGGREPWCESIAVPELDMEAELVPNIQGGWASGPLRGSVFGTNEFVNHVTERAKRVVFITPRRVELVDRQITTQTHIAPDGSNLTDVLHFLRSNRPDQFLALEEFIKGAFPNVKQLTVLLDENQIEIHGSPALLYHNRPTPVPLRRCGSGIEQMLVLGVAVLAAYDDSLILIDEPQAYLHPHAERSLLELLDSHADQQFIIATHSHQLLHSKPLRHARLVSLADGSSVIGQPTKASEVLETLGVTAADLWLSDKVLWVEGPSEEAAFSELRNRLPKLDASERVEIRAMPGNASRFAGKSDKQANEVYRFCEQVSAAVAPLPITMRFLFDRDEKPAQFIETLERRSNDRARFLACRELENMFLHSDAVVSAIRERAADLDLNVPDAEPIRARLTELLADTKNVALFPSGVDDGADVKRIVKGSAVLDDLFFTFTKSQYDKVKDASMMVRHVYKAAPGELEDLMAALREFSTADDSTLGEGSKQ